MGFGAQELFDLLVVLVPLLLSLTVHEFAHARTALAFGDPTAKLMGRVSLNPLRHLDPLGTIVLLVTRIIGWAKPVPVNPHNLHPRGLGDIAVSLAGPMSNMMLAGCAALLMRIMLTVIPESADSQLLRVAYLQLFTLLSLNLGLCMFNLLPLFPLDGHHIVRELLPVRKHADFMHWQLRFGRLLLAAIILIPPLAHRVAGVAVFSPVRWAHTRVLLAAIRGFGVEGVFQFLAD